MVVRVKRIQRHKLKSTGCIAKLHVFIFDMCPHCRYLNVRDEVYGLYKGEENHKFVLVRCDNCETHYARNIALGESNPENMEYTKGTMVVVIE